MIWDKRLVATGAALAVTVAVAVTAALLPGREQESVPMQEAAMPGVEAMQPQTPQPKAEDDYLYIIKEYQGRIAIFARDSDTPELIFDKQLKHLPEYDRIQMEEGIKIYSSEELNARIEDYIS